MKLTIRLGLVQVAVLAAFNSQGLAQALPDAEAIRSQQAIATVNGQPISLGELEYLFFARGVKPDERGVFQANLVDELIDRQLIREFLTGRKFVTLDAELDGQIGRVYDQIRKSGQEPAQFLEKIGFTEARLRTHLGLQVSWQTYVRLSVTDAQISEYFKAHRRELDGTKLRVSQIFLKKGDAADVAGQVSKLRVIKGEILEGKLKFAEAAEKYSESPSGRKGGDVGVITPIGDLPPAVSAAAYQLPVNQVSDPIESPFGAHLILVTKEIPGQYTQEDARPQILVKLSDQLWKQTVNERRKTSKIERLAVK